MTSVAARELSRHADAAMQPDHSTMKLTVQQPTAREIKMLLAGGQSAALVVPPEHPVLAQLLAVVAGVDGGPHVPHPSVFQIPMEGGRAALAFAAHELVGVI